MLVFALFASAAFGQTANSYQQTNLVSDIPGAAARTDPDLINPWGISFFPGQPFWIADNGSGFSTVYDQTGTTQLQPVMIATPAGSTSPAAVTGTVSNATSDFAVHGVPSLFLFSSEDGTITGWGGAGSAALAVDNSGAGAVYKGLANGSNSTGNFLYATNFRTGKVDVFDRNFNPATLAGSFTDPNLPAGYAPFGIQNIGNNQLVVTYALQDSAKQDDVAGAGNGYVDMYDTDGHFVRRVASTGTLNSPWGIAVAPAGFGAFGSALLIGNFGDGRINAFDSNGNLLGQLDDNNGQPLSIDGLWAVTFGGGGMSGDPNSLYFAAGPNGETHGLFGKLVAVPASGGAGDFTLAASQQTLTVTRGNSVTLQVNIGSTGGFASAVNLACSAPTMITCTFSPSSITPGSSSQSVSLNVAVASNYPITNPYMASVRGRWMLALTLFGGMVCVIPPQRSRRKILTALGIGLIGLVLVLAGCGGGKSSTSTNTGGGTSSANLTITGTSGTISHAATVALTIQ
jgi:uncharacterized protein (TIGR03118 family)